MLSPSPTQKITFYLKASSLRPQIRKPSLAKNYCQLMNNEIDKLKDDDDLYINGYRFENLIDNPKNENNLKRTFYSKKNDNLAETNKFNNKFNPKNIKKNDENEANSLKNERNGGEDIKNNEGLIENPDCDLTKKNELIFKMKNSFEDFDAVDKNFDQNAFFENFDVKVKNKNNFDYELDTDQILDKNNIKTNGKGQFRNNFSSQNFNKDNFRGDDRPLKNQEFRRISKDGNRLSNDLNMEKLTSIKKNQNISLKSLKNTM